MMSTGNGLEIDSLLPSYVRATYVDTSLDHTLPNLWRRGVTPSEVSTTYVHAAHLWLKF